MTQFTDAAGTVEQEQPKQAVEQVSVEEHNQEQNQQQQLDSDGMPIKFTDAAASKVKELLEEEENPALKLRVYVTGGGCSGFQYGFTFDEKNNDGDFTIEKQGVKLVVDPMSLQYLMGGEVDYTSGLEGSRFFVKNPNATTTCGCGASFSV